VTDDFDRLNDTRRDDRQARRNLRDRWFCSIAIARADFPLQAKASTNITLLTLGGGSQHDL
jgi:hypothetical protein